MGEIISVQNCFYKYEDGTEAIRGVSFSIKKGEKVAFLGANGSGKSTLFLCMNGVLRPTKGKILLENSPIVYNRKGLLKHRSNVGIVFQEPDNQLFSASVYQEISFGILNNVICLLTGLGELATIRRQFVAHAEEAVKI